MTFASEVWTVSSCNMQWCIHELGLNFNLVSHEYCSHQNIDTSIFSAFSDSQLVSLWGNSCTALKYFFECRLKLLPVCLMNYEGVSLKVRENRLSSILAVCFSWTIAVSIIYSVWMFPFSHIQYSSTLRGFHNEGKTQGWRTADVCRLTQHLSRFRPACVCFSALGIGVVCR